MHKSTKYQSASSNVTQLGSVVPKQLITIIKYLAKIGVLSANIQVKTYD